MQRIITDIVWLCRFVAIRIWVSRVQDRKLLTWGPKNTRRQESEVHGIWQNTRSPGHWFLQIFCNVFRWIYAKHFGCQELRLMKDEYVTNCEDYLLNFFHAFWSHVACIKSRHQKTNQTFCNCTVWSVLMQQC